MCLFYRMIVIHSCLTVEARDENEDNNEDDENDNEEENEILDGNMHVDVLVLPSHINAGASCRTNDQTRAGVDAHCGIFIECFAPSSAGKPITNQDKPDNDHDIYWRQLARPDCTSIYHPFASQIDWEIAHWAKVHGITSSAVSELLGVKGVSILLYIYLLVSDILFRYPRSLNFRIRISENLIPLWNLNSRR